MPEMHFKVQWPDGAQDTCYSPSLVIKSYFEPGQDYELQDFVERSRTALNIASDRVQAKYGRPCGLAIGQLAAIENKAAGFGNSPGAIVRVLEFLD
jgi:uncharacterized repeat protein (TIGR04042 family)